MSFEVNRFPNAFLLEIHLQKMQPGETVQDLRDRIQTGKKESQPVSLALLDILEERVIKSSSEPAVLEDADIVASLRALREANKLVASFDVRGPRSPKPDGKLDEGEKQAVLANEDPTDPFSVMAAELIRKGKAPGWL